MMYTFSRAPKYDLSAGPTSAVARDNLAVLRDAIRVVSHVNQPLTSRDYIVSSTHYFTSQNDEIVKKTQQLKQMQANLTQALDLIRQDDESIVKIRKAINATS